MVAGEDGVVVRCGWGSRRVMTDNEGTMRR